MPANVFTRDGVEIRRLKSGRCVLEDEWQQYVEINKVLRIPYMLENEPFAKLPVPYIPLPKVNHYPPMFRLGFALPDPFAEFRRAALKNNLGDPEQLSTTQDFSWLRRLVMSHINERCGFPPEKGIGYRLVHSKETDLVIEIDTNYRTRIPEEKLDDALCVIREVLLLPGDAHPKWYLEPTITEKAPNKYCLPMSVIPWSACD